MVVTINQLMELLTCRPGAHCTIFYISMITLNLISVLLPSPNIDGKYLTEF